MTRSPEIYATLEVTMRVRVRILGDSLAEALIRANELEAQDIIEIRANGGLGGPDDVRSIDVEVVAIGRLDGID